MSGGYFNYIDSQLKHEIFGYSGKWHNALEDRELSEMTFDLLNVLHEYDWYVSGDTDAEHYIKAKEEFKAKWLGDCNARVKHVVDSALNSLRRELYDTYGVKEEENG